MNHAPMPIIQIHAFKKNKCKINTEGKVNRGIPSL